MPATLKQLTARSMKWNVIDRVASQVLYAITGIVLARLLSQEDFGLVGACLVFQAFASLFVDSGFSYALIQRKQPTRLDYSTVMWFNIGVAVALYALLFVGAPLIADCFGGDRRLIPLSRVMFLSFIINATAIVQTNRLMKKMDVKMVAVSNTVGLVAAGVVGIWLAVAGFGAWAIVWQTITLNATKSAILWLTSRWFPLMQFSSASLKSFFSVGAGMMATSFLNVLFQNIYSFFIGNRTGMAKLGYYTQADKWSKMGVTSITQVLTSSFLPALSEVQDQPERFARVAAKMDRFTAYLLFPAIIFLMVMAEPIFHVLFGAKWDPSIILFQILLARGIFTVLTTLYNNYLISLGMTRPVMWLEVVRDSVAIAMIVATISQIDLSLGADITYGLAIFLEGQLVASALTWVVTLVYAAPATHRSRWAYVVDCMPYLLLSLAIAALLMVEKFYIESAWLQLLAMAATALALYVGILAMLGSAIQRDVLRQIFRRPSAK